MRFHLLLPAVFLLATAFTSKSPSAATEKRLATPKASAAAAAVKPVVPKLAPLAVPHATAMFLAEWSQEGSRNVSFKASAVGTRFFLEQASGVTVYHFDGSGYVNEAFMAGANLASARKHYASQGAAR